VSEGDTDTLQVILETVLQAITCIGTDNKN